MATRAYFGIENMKKEVKYIYCHWDGYAAGLGEYMVEYIKKNSNKDILALYEKINFFDMRKEEFNDTQTYKKYREYSGLGSILDLQNDQRSRGLLGLVENDYFTFPYEKDTSGEWKYTVKIKNLNKGYLEIKFDLIFPWAIATIKIDFESIRKTNFSLQEVFKAELSYEG